MPHSRFQRDFCTLRPRLRGLRSLGFCAGIGRFQRASPSFSYFVLTHPVGLWRNTEQNWRDQHVRVRSPVSAKHRGGAAMTAACMTLLAHHNGPIWPFRERGIGATICEAFPAAQRRHWCLPYERYNGEAKSAREIRSKITSILVQQRALHVDEGHLGSCLSSADALDAVLCLYAAAAVSSQTHPESETRFEGQIVVHD
jgi:hypothetical protein